MQKFFKNLEIGSGWNSYFSNGTNLMKYNSITIIYWDRKSNNFFLNSCSAAIYGFHNFIGTMRPPRKELEDHHTRKKRSFEQKLLTKETMTEGELNETVQKILEEGTDCMERIEEQQGVYSKVII